MYEQRKFHPVQSALTFVRRGINDGIAAWHRFWFEPLDPLMLGIIRLLTGWMLFYNLLVWSLQLETFFGRNGVQPLETVKRLYESRHVFSFWLWIDDAYLWPVHIACLAVVAMFCIGAATRLTSIMAFLITISYSQRVPVANFGFDQILGMMCLYLAMAPCGAAVSVDNLVSKWWRRRKGLPRKSAPIRFASARMASRLIQLHLCAIYFWSGFSKLKGSTWWTGEAMWNVIANQEYQTIDLTWIAWTPWLAYLISHITIAWEAFFIVLIWNRRLRPLMLAMGTAMHFGIGAFMGMWTFGLIMTFAYLSFVDPEKWRAVFTGLHRWRKARKAAAKSAHHMALSLRPPPNFAVAAAQTPSQRKSAVTELTTDVPMISKDVVAPPMSTPLYSVLVIANDPQHRNALREHLRGHQFDCRAVDSSDRAMHLLHRQQFSAIVIHGSGYFRADLLNLVSDFLDYGNVPVLVLLAGSQNALASHIDTLAEVACHSLPASLREIRNSLESLLASCENPVSE